MSAPAKSHPTGHAPHTAASNGADHAVEPMEATEAIVPMIPIVLPIVGGVLMFLLAFIAVSMA